MLRSSHVFATSAFFGRGTVRLFNPLVGVALAYTLVCDAHAATDLTTLRLEQLMGIPVVGASKYEQKQSAVAAAVRVITRVEIRNFGWRTLDHPSQQQPT